MKPGVKICGLNDPAGIRAARGAGAAYIGFVFFDRSPRHVTAEQARDLIGQTGAPDSATPQTVGLFVKADDHLIASVLDQVRLDILQIYDTPERARTLRQRFGIPVWLSCGVTGQNDLPGAYEVDGYVIEPRAPTHASRPGGNGQVMDWSVLHGWSAPLPWMLAGGLNPSNIRSAMSQSGALSVDVSSGVEVAPGIKSPELIRNFIKNAQGSCTHGEK